MSRSGICNLMCSVILGGAMSVLAVGCGSAAPASSTSMSPSAPSQAFTSPSKMVSPSNDATSPIAMASTPTPGGGTGVSEDLPTYQAEITRARPDRLTFDQVATWAQQGTRDDIIIDRIERAQTIFRLSAADEQNLRQQGVSEDVICAMKETARR